MWKILVVDDSRTSRALLARMIDKMGHEILMATCGTEALDLCERHHPDLMLLDVVMPDMDGWELACRLRQRDRLRMVPIVYQSSVEEPEEIARCLASGAVSVIPKPVRYNVLEHTFKQMLGSPDAILAPGSLARMAAAAMILNPNRAAPQAPLRQAPLRQAPLQQASFEPR